MTIIELKIELSTLIKAVHAQVYYEEAPDNAVYPYVVFELSNSINTNLGYEQFVLDVDGWDNKTDTTALETMMHKIDVALHRHTSIFDITYPGDDVLPGEDTVPGTDKSATIYRENRRVVRDPDKRVRRRSYVYQVRVHGV